jgi:hypothetical protein
VDPFKLVPASYCLHHLCPVYCTHRIGRLDCEKLFKVAAAELKTAKDSLVKLNTEVALQRTNHLHHIEENTAETLTLLEA